MLGKGCMYPDLDLHHQHPSPTPATARIGKQRDRINKVVRNITSIPFSAFWLRSSVVSVLISLISDTWTNGSHDIKLIF